jgi:hypothetical protein
MAKTGAPALLYPNLFSDEELTGVESCVFDDLRDQWLERRAAPIPMQSPPPPCATRGTQARDLRARAATGNRSARNSRLNCCWASDRLHLADVE